MFTQLRRAFAQVGTGWGILVLGCGGGTTAPATPQPTPEALSVTAATVATEARHNIPEGGKVQSPKLIDRRERSSLAADTLDVVRSQSEPPKTSQELYRAVAPATVIIRVPDGIGSGVIIDPAGWILTNHHVVQNGKTSAFKVTVQVVLGTLSPATGGMERSTKELEAVVYKSDQLRDLALLKLVDPPPSLPSVPVAKQNPTPGQDVTAIGHAGAGMLWALKNGEVAALGELSEHLASLARFGSEDVEAAKEFREYLDSMHLGLVIQSTCSILPGDSGGPLVNRSGELVGLNAFGRQDPRTGGLVSFHVHVDEIRKFVAERPPRPKLSVPDPWAEGGGDASYEDVDLDGRVDVLFMQGRRPCISCPRQSSAIFVDADQDSYQGRSLPAITDAFAKHDFDAEFVCLQVEEKTLIWYDSDNNGSLDLLLVDQATDGTVDEAYKVGGEDELEVASGLAAGAPVRSALLVDTALRGRLDRVGSAVFPAGYTQASAPLAAALPSPIPAAGTGQLQDLDGDGDSDSLLVENSFSTRLLVDVSRSFVGGMQSSTPVEQLAPASLQSEVAVVSQGTHIWVWYDTDDDQVFDLVLHAPGSRVYAAVEAFRVDASGGRVPAPEAVGRKLVRPSLLRDPNQQKTLYRLLQKKRLTTLMSALVDDGLDSFPDPVADHRGAGTMLVPLDKAKKTLVTMSGQGSESYLMDLDESSWRYRNMKQVDVTAEVDGGKFDAEVAVFKRNGVAWVFYDTDNQRGYDLVLVSTAVETGRADHAFRIDQRGQVSLDPSFAGRPLIVPRELKSDKQRKALAYVAGEVFVDRVIEAL